MKLKINFASLSLLIVVFTFQSQHTVGQTGGNGVNSNLVSEVNPSLNAELVREPRDSRSAKEDKPEHVEIASEKADDRITVGSMEKEHADDEDGSYSSSSSSSEESDSFTSSTIGTTARPRSNESSAALGNKIKLMKMDTARLIKPRDARKGENWYAHKRSASGGGSGGVKPSSGTRSGSGGGGRSNSGARSGSGNARPSYRSGTKQKQPQQRRKQKGRNMGEEEEDEGFSTDGEGASPTGHNKPSGPTGLPGAGKGGKDPFGNNNVGGQKGGGDVLVNKTSKKPFNVERATRPVDPSVYSFFQFKPSESIGFLWTQSAGLGGSSVLGRTDLLGNDRGTDEDDLDPSNMYDWEFRRYDRACLYVEYTVYKAQMNSTQVSEEVSRMVDGQNEQLARRFLDWQFINKEDPETIALKGEGENHPQYLTYKFLTMTMEIFRDKICRNATPYATAPEIKPFAPASAPSKAEANKKYIDTKLLPKSFVDDIFRLFLTLRDITVPKGVPDYATKKDEEDIYTDVLENCLKLDPIQWYSHTCADQVLSYDDPYNYACTPLIDYDYNYKEYDPILDGMWHMFSAVHAYCFDEFNKRSLRLWHKYSMIIANSFTVGMRTRWKASIAEPRFYRRLLGPDHTTHMETMNRCMFAATLRSSAPAVLPRFLSVAPITFQKERTIGKDAAEVHPKV